MIRRKTLLILGAGASAPYGFPTGPALMDRIVSICEESNSPARLCLRGAGVADVQLQELRAALVQTQFDSIDTFLEHRKGFRDVGKLAIAAALIPWEESKGLTTRNRPSHWYRLLFNALHRPTGFDGRNLSIISFNYDRSLEQYLLNSIQQDFGVSASDAAVKVRTARFIHPHGTLGRLPWWVSDQTDGFVRAYEDSLSPDCLKAAATEIKIVGELGSRRDIYSMEHIRGTVEEAEVVGFLGFGYHLDVLQRLGIPEVLADGRGRWVVGSAYGLPLGRRDELMEQIPGLQLGSDSAGCYEFLQQTGLLYQTEPKRVTR